VVIMLSCLRTPSLWGGTPDYKWTMPHKYSKNCQHMLCKAHTCFTGTLKTS